MKIRFGPKKNEGGKEEQIQNQTESHDNQEKNTQDQQGETKKQPESIRHVIKLDNSESETDQKKEQSEETNAEDEEKQEAQKKKGKDVKTKQENQEEPLKKQIEEKKEYLKQIKEFDFRISENQKQLEEFSKQISTVNENLDDLVSLYEIVSEQMNPFVGLSGVTKKRIEVLENYSKDIEVLKTKMMELESDLEQLTSGSGAVLKRNKGQQAMNQTTMASQPQSNMQPPQQVVSAKNQDINTTQPIDPPTESFSYCDWENDISEDELEEIIEKTLDDITIDHEIEQKLMTLLDKDE